MTADRLPEAELEVLACLWQRGEATAREVRETIEPYRPLAHASVLTLLGRLESKGLLDRRKADTGKAYVYRPTKKPDPTYRRLMSDTLERVFGGDGIAMVASLFEAKAPTAEELTEFENLLNDLKRRQQTQRRGK